MKQDLISVKKTICDVAHEVWNQGLIDFPDANISMLLDFDGRKAFLATSTESDKRVLTPDSIRIYNENGQEIDSSGNPVTANNKKPTKDLNIHLGIYDATDYNAKAVLHTHGFYAMLYAAAFSGKGFNHPLGRLDERDAYLSIDQARLGKVAIMAPDSSGTNTIETCVSAFAVNSRIILVPTSGSYIYSTIDNPEKALWNCLYAARNLEKWAKHYLPASFEFAGDKILRETFEKYKDASRGELPLFEQMKNSGV